MASTLGKTLPSPPVCLLMVLSCSTPGTPQFFLPVSPMWPAGPFLGGWILRPNDPRTQPASVWWQTITHELPDAW